MGAISKKLRCVEGKRLMFWCPGCDDPHMINIKKADGPGWTYNGNPDAPSFSPSVLVQSGHYFEPDRPCWCTFEERTGQKSDFKCYQCHSFVTDGKIQFLSDSTHALAGQTVDLPDFDDRRL